MYLFILNELDRSKEMMGQETFSSCLLISRKIKSYYEVIISTSNYTHFVANEKRCEIYR